MRINASNGVSVPAVELRFSGTNSAR